MPPLPQVFSSSTTVLLDKVLPHFLVDWLGFEDQFQTKYFPKTFSPSTADLLD